MFRDTMDWRPAFRGLDIQPAEQRRLTNIVDVAVSTKPELAFDWLPG